jgi:glycine/D-amino acid oxidase-like deaminating enzyme
MADGAKIRIADRTDVVVVGGGVIGCSVAYYLAKAGARVVVMDAASVGSGASSANSGGINLATKKPGIAMRLGIVSRRLYGGLAAELDTDLEHHVTGKLIIAETETELAFLETMCTEQRAAGAPVEMVATERCRALNPLLEGRVLGGLYCPADAQANPFKVTQAYARAAQDRGAVIVTGTEVRSIETEGSRVRRVQTSKGSIETRWVVNAAGARAAEVGAMVGVEHNVKPWRGQVVVLEASTDYPVISVSGASQMVSKHAAAGAPRDPLNLAFSYQPRPDSGTVLLGSTYEFAGHDTRTTHAATTGICRVNARVMPRLGRACAVRSWAGLRPYSPTGPILGRVDGPDGYVVATGHGGDGMALSPVTGSYLAALIARDGQAYELGTFLDDLERVPA